MATVTEQVEGFQSSLQHKADKSGLQETKQQVQEVQQQGQNTSQALTELHSSVRQQGQDQATALQRLEALMATASHGTTACLYDNTLVMQAQHQQTNS